jgi:hypothetical protein
VRVQRCDIRPNLGLTPRAVPVDLRVMLWTGVVVHVYILTEAMKSRSLRSLLQLESNQGIGVLFVVAPELLPGPDEAVVPPDWMMALHALAHERIYSYPLDSATSLLQIHLDRLDATERARAIYGPPVDVEDLNFGRVNVRLRAIKGSWLTAHFGQQAFWQGETRAYTPPPRNQYQRSSGTSSRAYSNTVPPNNNASNNNSRSALPKRPANRLEASYALLGVATNASEDDVKLAFRRRVFSVHPDVSALPKSMAEEQFRALAEAYEYIKEKRGWS